MPKIAIGADELDTLYVGADEIVAAYVGEELVYAVEGEAGETLVTVLAEGGGSAATPGVNITMAFRGVAVLNDAVVTKIGVYNTTATTGKVKIVKRNSAGNYDVDVDQAMSHPGTGWFDVTLSAPYPVPGSGTYYIGAYQPNANHYAIGGQLRAIAFSDITGTGQGLTEQSGESVWPMRYYYV